jgi:hypothetical protein
MAEIRAAKTVCVRAVKARPLEVIASTRDTETESCYTDIRTVEPISASPSRPEGGMKMPRRLHGSGFWKRRARLQLQMQPLCEMCLREGRGPVPARVADHVEPHGGDANKFILGRLQSLCVPCHSGRKQSIEKLGYDKTVGVDGWPVDPNHPVYR